MSSKKLLRFPTLCSSPGCLSFTLAKGLCSKHYWHFHQKLTTPLRRRRRHSIALATWMLRPSFTNPSQEPARTPHPFTPTNKRVRQGTAPPLTPSQQLAHRRLLNQLISRRRPQTATELSHCHTIASCWIRGGGPLLKGYHNNSHPIMIASRKAGWLRKWLRTGDYDPLLLDSLLSQARSPQSKKDSLLTKAKYKSTSTNDERPR